MEKCTEFYDKMGDHGSDIPEPPPTPSVESKAIWDLVIEDIREKYSTYCSDLRQTFINDAKKRDEMGTKKYGTRLCAFDGRSTLWDAYQESLDQVVYIRKALFEGHYTNTTNFDATREFNLLKLYQKALDVSAVLCLMVERPIEK